MTTVALILAAWAVLPMLALTLVSTTRKADR